MFFHFNISLSNSTANTLIIIVYNYVPCLKTVGTIKRLFVVSPKLKTLFRYSD